MYLIIQNIHLQHLFYETQYTKLNNIHNNSAQWHHNEIYPIILLFYRICIIWMLSSIIYAKPLLNITNTS